MPINSSKMCSRLERPNINILYEFQVSTITFNLDEKQKPNTHHSNTNTFSLQ